MAEIKRILLAEDNLKDVELTLVALDEYHLANEVVVANDGSEALDYLYKRGRFAMRPVGNPVVVLLDDPGSDPHLVARGAGLGEELQPGRQRLCGQTGGV